MIAYRVVVFSLLLATAFAQITPKTGPLARYEIIELPLRPSSISNSGFVAGATEDQHAATWSPQAGLFRIPLPTEFSFSECAGVNSRGDAVGTASTADYSRRVAFVLRQKNVSLLSGGQARANSINEAGQIVGQGIPPVGKVAGPVLWKDGSLLDLQICCAGSARGVNSQGIIIGDTYDKDGRYHAFVWDAAHGTHVLNVPGEEYSSALALNSRGDILLKATPGGLFLYSESTMHPVDMPKASPRAMNDDGIVVGSYGSNPEAQSAFVWDRTHGM